jgi:hypothetical protein
VPLREAQIAYLSQLVDWANYIAADRLTMPNVPSPPAPRPTGLGLTPQELLLLLPAARTAKVQLDAARDELSRAAPAGQSAILSRRRDAIDRAVADWRSKLTAEAWSRLEQHIQQRTAVPSSK